MTESRIETIWGRNGEDTSLPGVSVTPAIFDRNIEIIKARFPRAAGLILESRRNYTDIVVSDTEEGSVIINSGQCQDHPTKPKSSGEAWATRSLLDPRIADAEAIIVYGFGVGYHVESLISKAKSKIIVIEPSIESFRRALETRDISQALSQLSDLCVGTQFLPENVPSRVELLIRPQTQALFTDHVSKVRTFSYEHRGFAVLKPKIGIVGPMAGGTLPIAGYCANSLGNLNQLTREIDVSGFSPGYHELKKFLKLEQRRAVVENHYAQMVSNVILESINEHPVDIVLCMAQAPLAGSALQELRRRGIITVLWFVEDYLRFTYWRDMAKFYDFVFTIQKGPCIESIRRAGAGEVHYLPMAADPSIHRPMTLSPEEKEHWGSPLSFVGAGYHNRQHVFAGLVDYPFKIWGTEWPECKPFIKMVQEGGRRLTPEEYVKIFNSTDININLHSSSERNDVDPFGDFVNPRTFELAACGAFQLVDERTLLPEVFVPGQEIATFKDSKDLKEKITYYSERPEERTKIAEAGRSRVLRDHTYDARLKQMLGLIYGAKFEHLYERQMSNPWINMIRRSAKDSELKERCQAAFERGDLPKLDALVFDILSGKGKLTETEQKLLFLHHVTTQIVQMKREEKGG